jgi:hypothetical protein
VYEEALSRGYHLKNLAEGFSGAGPGAAAVLAMLASALIFAALHSLNPNFNVNAFAGLTLAGLLYALPVALTGRLGMSIGLHMAWNFTQGGVFGFPDSGDREDVSLFLVTPAGPSSWTGGEFGPEAGYLGWAAMISGMVGVFVFARLRGKGVAGPGLSRYEPRGQ